MVTDPALREALHAIIDQLTDEQAEDLLDYLNLQADPDTLTPEEEAEVEEAERAIARGEFVTLEEVKARLARE